MIQFEKVVLTDLIVIVSLSLGFIASAVDCERELAMSLATGLLGYVGGNVTKNGTHKEN